MIEKIKLHKDQTSFTLLELILIIAIISILLGSSLPLINKNIKSTSFKSFVNEIFLLFDYARTRATLNNNISEIVLDLDQNTVSLFDQSPESDIDQEKAVIVVRRLTAPSGISLESEISKIVFFPDGTLNNFSLMISNKNNNAIISSNGFDGKIRIE